MWALERGRIIHPLFFINKVNEFVNLERQITTLLTEKFSEPTFSDCYIIEINLKPKQKLMVFVDSDSGMTFAKCKQISRHLEAHLDETLLLGEKYTLEVSSPGIDRPLKLRRQYIKNLNRQLKVQVEDFENPIIGKLIAIDEEGITLQTTEKIKEGKKNKQITIQHTFPFEKIKEAIVQVSF